jgi:hypothetical protein
MPATFDKETYRAVRDEVKRDLSAMRMLHFFLVNYMKSLMNCLRHYRCEGRWHESDREHMRELSALMARDLQKMTRLVNDTRRKVAEYIEESEEKRRADRAF